MLLKTDKKMLNNWFKLFKTSSKLSQRITIRGGIPNSSGSSMNFIFIKICLPHSTRKYRVYSMVIQNLSVLKNQSVLHSINFHKYEYFQRKNSKANKTKFFTKKYPNIRFSFSRDTIIMFSNSNHQINLLLRRTKISSF